MAQQGDTYFNPVTNTKLVFTAAARDSGGRELVMDWFVAAGERLAAAAHCHTGPDGLLIEFFDVIAGHAACRIGKETVEASAPLTFAIPTNTPHVHPWNIGRGALHVRQRIVLPEPDLALLEGVERFFETLTALSQQGRANRKGDIRNPLQGALVLTDGLLPVTHLAGIPVGLQMKVLNALSTLGTALGYRAHIMPEKA
jgi:hypothetical protein